MPRIQREPGETWRSTVIMPFSRQWLYKRQFENDDWLSPAGVRRLCPGREESRGAHTHTHTHTYPHPHRHSHTQTHPHTRARIPNERKPTLSARPPADVVFDPTTLRVFPQSCPSITAPLPRYIYMCLCTPVHKNIWDLAAAHARVYIRGLCATHSPVAHATYPPSPTLVSAGKSAGRRVKMCFKIILY